MKTAQMKVELIDHMGTDLTVVNAARVSFDKVSEWEVIDHSIDPTTWMAGVETCLSKRDTKLINYLAKHNHWSPFAHTSIQLRVKAPIFVARQLVKHQVGLVWNEVSRRYVDSEPEFYFPDQWRGRPVNAKQGSSGVVEAPRVEIFGAVLDPYDVVYAVNDVYETMIERGVAPEQARMILPQNTMTEWIWTGSLMAFTRVCKQRLAPGAQLETREVAEQIAEIVAQLFPVSWSALMEE